ncbi:hypothetical protein [Hoyosella rhizosphaerae]|uniref:Uncharacterized protein n=1 Tax=Hoyosella rhizosphaerae TaxID=1755582 RepID=A0A916XEB5_9ACTN|nr:hypothetical protein [Hoyosella rhizosphaerae]GGC67284.1 hypothetical protein GCM10011410_19950 [Hoyosella rhizosphaerae]
MTAALFAVGCPVCNKLILLAIGTSGALSVWAPIQPILAVVAVLALGIATYLWWQRRPCADGRCSIDQVNTGGSVSEAKVP